MINLKQINISRYNQFSIENYSIKNQSIRKKLKIYCYKNNILDNIDEIMFYKTKKGFKLVDKQTIFFFDE